MIKTHFLSIKPIKILIKIELKSVFNKVGKKKCDFFYEVFSRQKGWA